MDALPQIGLFEVLCDVGVEASKAHALDKALEDKLLQGKKLTEEKMQEFATKQDLLNAKQEVLKEIQSLGERMSTEMQSVRADVFKAMNEQAWKLVTYVAVLNAAMFAIFRLAKLI